MRIRLLFSKTDAMRYTGHMDLHRALERTLRRASLPLTHSQGFTRRPKINIALALPLGVTGEAELADVWLDDDLSTESVREAVIASSPPGIRVHEIIEMDVNEPKLQKLVHSGDYMAALFDPLPDLDRRIADLLAADTLPRERRGKAYDLRPLVLALERLPDEPGTGRQRVGMTLMAQDSATGRPDEVVAALGGDPLAAKYHRTKIYLKKG